MQVSRYVDVAGMTIPVSQNFGHPVRLVQHRFEKGCDVYDEEYIICGSKLTTLMPLCSLLP